MSKLQVLSNFHTHTKFRYVKFNASILLEPATLKFSVQTLKTNFCNLCLQKLLSQLLMCWDFLYSNLFLVNAVNPIQTHMWKRHYSRQGGIIFFGLSSLWNDLNLGIYVYKFSNIFKNKRRVFTLTFLYRLKKELFIKQNEKRVVLALFLFIFVWRLRGCTIFEVCIKVAMK